MGEFPCVESLPKQHGQHENPGNPLSLSLSLSLAFSLSLYLYPRGMKQGADTLPLSPHLASLDFSMPGRCNLLQRVIQPLRGFDFRDLHEALTFQQERPSPHSTAKKGHTRNKNC